MKQGFSIVAFKVDTSHGMSKMLGLAKFSAAGIVLEFEEEFLGLVKSGNVREVRIPITDILDIQFGKGFLGLFGSIIVRFKNLASLNGLYTKKGRLKMKVARADRNDAEQVVEVMRRTLNSEGQELPSATVRQLFGDEADTQELADTNEL
jgi:hypothetical protein